MHIQWFPGHMTKALREMQKNLSRVDLVIYLLDARCISSSFNPEFDKLFANKKILYVINKIDLVKSEDLSPWENYFQKNNLSYVKAISTSKNMKNKIVSQINLASKEIIERYKLKGVNKIIHALVVGIPNSGKSSFINTLCYSNKAITGNKPGVTRGIQSISISNNIELYDSPGTLMPYFKNQTIAQHLAFIGTINENILSIDELVLELLLFLYQNNKKELQERYSLSFDDSYVFDAYELFLEIARKKGCIFKGQKVDTNRAAKMIIDDFRLCKIGKIMLDKYEGQ